MSLKVCVTTRTSRREQHLFRVHKPETATALKRLSRRGMRRRIKREVIDPEDTNETDDYQDD